MPELISDLIIIWQQKWIIKGLNITKSAIDMIYSIICKSYEFCIMAAFFESSCINQLFDNITSLYASISIQWARFKN